MNRLNLKNSLDDFKEVIIKLRFWCWKKLGLKKKTLNEKVNLKSALLNSLH